MFWTQLVQCQSDVCVCLEEFIVKFIDESISLVPVVLKICVCFEKRAVFCLMGVCVCMLETFENVASWSTRLAACMCVCVCIYIVFKLQHSKLMHRNAEIDT